jgi:hypothetical protein
MRSDISWATVRVALGIFPYMRFGDFTFEEHNLSLTDLE